MRIYCFIHYYGSNDASLIFSELVQYVLASNLLAQIHEVHLLLSGDRSYGPASIDLAILGQKLIMHQPEDYFMHGSELDTLAIISKVSKEMSSVGACIYLHTKGASGNSLIQQAWRRYMLEFNVTCWANALNKLKSYHLYGVNWSYSNFNFDPDFPWSKSKLYGHFMGNFWWARSDYLSDLPTPSINWKSRYTAEAWIGLNGPKVFNAMRSNLPSPDEPYLPISYRKYVNVLRNPTVTVEVPRNMINSLGLAELDYPPTSDRFRHDPTWEYIIY